MKLLSSINNLFKWPYLIILFAGFFWTVIPAISSSSVVGSSEDAKVTGWPDSRKIARDSQGNLYVAFREKFRADTQLRYHIYVAKSIDNGNTWDIINNGEPIETVGDHTQRVPSIAIDASDNIHIVWYGWDDDNTGDQETQIKYTRSTDGGLTWSTWSNIAEVFGYTNETIWQAHPVIFIDGNNNLYVVWQGRDPSHTNSSQTKFIKSSDGGNSWTAWKNIEPSTSDNFSRPTVVYGFSNNTLFIIAYGNVGNEQQIVWTKSSDGGVNWTPWDLVAPDGNDQRHLSVAVDNNNHLHLVWRQIPDGQSTTQIHYSLFDGNVWSSPVLVGPNIDMYQYFPSISVSSENKVSVVWTESPDPNPNSNDDPTTGDVFYSSNNGNGWNERIQITENGVSLYPSIRWGRHHNDETIDIIWTEGYLDYYRIKHLHCDVIENPIGKNINEPIIKGNDVIVTIGNTNACGSSPESFRNIFLPTVLKT